MDLPLHLNVQHLARSRYGVFFLNYLAGDVHAVFERKPPLGQVIGERDQGSSHEQGNLLLIQDLQNHLGSSLESWRWLNPRAANTIKGLFPG